MWHGQPPDVLTVDGDQLLYRVEWPQTNEGLEQNQDKDMKMVIKIGKTFVYCLCHYKLTPGIEEHIKCSHLQTIMWKEAVKDQSWQIDIVEF